LAVLYITEFKTLTTPVTFGTPVQCPYAGYALTEKTIALTTASTTCSTFSAQCRFIMVNTDTASFLAFSGDATAPTATVSAHRMGANETRFYGVQAGGCMAAVIA
jgi:hypothetical protein